MTVGSAAQQYLSTVLPGLICGGVSFLAAGIFLLWVSWPASVLVYSAIKCRAACPNTGV